MFLRKIDSFNRRLIRLWQLYQSYRHKHAGLAGLIRLAVRLYEPLAKGNLDNLRNTIAAYECNFTDSLDLTKPFALRPIYSLSDFESDYTPTIQNIAVHAHIYYPDLTSEIKSYLKNIPTSFDLYVTTNSEDKAVYIKNVLTGLRGLRELDIRVVPNRGRDIGPMLVELGETLSNYEVVLHIHTKRSPHNPDLRGWRRYLMQSLLGNSRRVAAILNCFAKDEELGILYPQIYHPVIPFMRIGGNAAGLRALLSKAGRDPEDVNKLDMSAFPAGFMMWFRGRAIEPFIRLKLRLEDFDAEAGQDDSTLAHAIERIFPYMAAIGGFRSQIFLPDRLHDPVNPGAVPFKELLSILPTSSLSVCILFDHKNSESENQNILHLINEAIVNGRTVLRIYYSDFAWFVDWIAADDGMIFVEPDTSALFETLAKVTAKSIIVNSLAPYPEIDRLSECIETLAKAYSISISYNTGKS